MSAPTSTEKKAHRDSGVSDETLLKVSKEIAVKFIEMGRITPGTFDACFKDIYTAIEKTVKRG